MECNLCLASEGSRLSTLAAQGGLDAQPANIPNNIWRHRSWFAMCLICFTNLLRNGPPHSEENFNEEDNKNDLAWVNLDFTPSIDEQENMFWGVFKEQRIDDYVEELAVMLSENAQNTVDLDALADSFWSV